MPKVQEWLDREYPQEVRNKISNLDLKSENLTGELFIENWPNLERLDCGFNQLTSIKIRNLSKLTFFSARNCQISALSVNNCHEISYFNIKKNSLFDLTFVSNLNPEKLTFLDLGNNKFLPQDLSVFNNLISLKEFYLGDKFCGSLEPLKSLTNLKSLGIFTPSIDSGLEYLTVNLERIYLHSKREEDKSLAIWEEMKNYPTKDKHEFLCYDYQVWRKDNAERIELLNIDKVTLLRQFKSLKEEYTELQKRFGQLQEQMISLEKKILQNNPAIVISPNFSNIATGSVSPQQGNALIGNTLGDNPNFSHETTTHQQETKVIEREEKLEAKIEQLPKTKPWKQLFVKKS